MVVAVMMMMMTMMMMMMTMMTTMMSECGSGEGVYPLASIALHVLHLLHVQVIAVRSRVDGCALQLAPPLFERLTVAAGGCTR
jgi:uncharacterized lipoprotein YmbA